MIKKVFIFLSLSFLVFLVSLYFYRQKQLEIKKALSEVESINSDLEIKKINSTLSALSTNTGFNSSGTDLSIEEKKKELEKMIANQLVDIDSFSNSTGVSLELRYKKLYSSYIGKNNVYGAIKAIKRLLKYTNHKDIWYEKLVDLYIKIGKFKEAEKIAEQLIKNHPTKDILLKYLYIKFQNTNFFDQKQVNTLKSIVSGFYKEGILSLDDLTFYNFLIDLLSNWDTSKLEIVLNSLIKDIKNPVYKNILYSFKKDLEVYKNNPGAPLYYFKALVALDLLKYGYFGIAKNIAESVYIEDSDYVLPKQILAYSYFYMGNYKQALKYFHELKDDVDNDNEYNFFIGISYYWLGDYRNALLYLAEVKKDFSYYLDVLRYEFLIYKKIKDTDKIIDVISSMLKYKLSYVDYYNIFKYLLFDCSNCYKENLKLLVNLLKKCYKDTDSSTEYVCWYGKANLFYKAGKIKYSIKYFELLTKYFQDAYIYEILGKYYENKKNIKKARYYYLKELLYTIDEHKREQVKEKIKKLYLKNRD